MKKGYATREKAEKMEKAIYTATAGVWCLSI